jgi:hypothetical protein
VYLFVVLGRCRVEEVEGWYGMMRTTMEGLPQIYILKLKLQLLYVKANHSVDRKRKSRGPRA